MKIIKIIVLLLISNYVCAKNGSKFIELNKCVLQTSDNTETKYSGKQYMNLTKVENIMTALNHVELMQNGQQLLVMATPEEKKLIVQAFIDCSK